MPWDRSSFLRVLCILLQGGPVKVTSFLWGPPPALRLQRLQAMVMPPVGCCSLGNSTVQVENRLKKFNRGSSPDLTQDAVILAITVMTL